MKNKRINSVGIRDFRKLKCIIVACLVATSCWAVDFSAKLAYSQKTQISLNLSNKTLKEVFKEIERSSEFVIFYYEGVVDSNKRVKLKVKDQTVDKILDKLFEGTDNAYNIVDKQIYITKKSEKENVAPALPVSQQQKKIAGKVIDESGEPLPGVAIQVKGTPRGVTTDIDGSFTLEVKDTDILAFSYLGMQDQEISVANKKQLLVTMKEKMDELEEVTVVAFAKQKKESVLASIATVKPGDLKVPSSNLTTALAGRMAGIISYQRSGEPGQDNADFFIRGVTTFGYKVDPLILIDGVELTTDDLARLQTDDIASFSIMKDATATALYGARGANGVILVTTKEGSEGKAKVSVRFENSFASPTKDIELADPITYMELHNEAVLTRDPLGVLPYTQEKIAGTKAGLNPYVYPATNWKKALIKDFTSNQRLNFNISGGGKVARYYLAGGFTQDNGVLNVDKRNNFNSNINLKRYLLRGNININLTKTTEAVVRLNGTFEDYTGPIDGGTGLYNKIMRTNPVLFPAFYEPDEANKYKNHILFGNYGDEGNYINPYADLVKGYKDYSKSMMLFQFELKQDFGFLLEGLSARFMMNTNRSSYFDVSRFYNPFYYNVSSYDPMNNTYQLYPLNENSGTEYLGYNEGTKTITTNNYFEGAIQYNHTFGKVHGVSGLLVGTLRQSLSGNAGNLQLSLPNRNTGLSGRFTYSFDDRYFGEFNFGYNGSERFEKRNRFGFFPSFGLGWVISNESFFSALSSKINKLKLKATYGLVGNDAIGSPSDRFFYLSNVNMNDSNRGYRFGNNFDYSRNGISVSRYADPYITWETSYKTNLGMELGLFNALDFQLDLFHDKRTNILMKRESIPPTMGLNADLSSNIGEATSQGVEFSIDYNKSFTKDYWLTGRANFTYANSEFKVYEEPDYSETPWRSKVGRNLSQEWGYVAERLFVDEEDVKNSPLQSFGEYGAGDIKYKDINEDGVINESDQVPIGYPTSPKIMYGFGFSTGYKDFDVSCFFQGSAMSSFWIDAKSTSPFADTDGDDSVHSNNALLKVYADSYWSESNRNVRALWPRLADRVIENNAKRNTWFMRDGSFLRLKSVEVGYSLPRSLVKKVGLGQCRVYFSGTNLLTFSKFKLWDPEQAGNGLGYPINKVINVGFQVSL